MIKHQIPATNTMNNKEVVLAVVTDGADKHVELQIEGALETLGGRSGPPGARLVLAIDNETAKQLANAMLKTVS